MKYIVISYLFDVINIHILRYKFSQTSNSLTENVKAGTICGTGGVGINTCIANVSYSCACMHSWLLCGVVISLIPVLLAIHLVPCFLFFLFRDTLVCG
jgi:hypothetical protein